MNNMIQKLEDMGFKKEQEKLEGFYESVKIRAQGLDNLEAKQKIIIQLYPNQLSHINIIKSIISNIHCFVKFYIIFVIFCVTVQPCRNDCAR